MGYIIIAFYNSLLMSYEEELEAKKRKRFIYFSSHQIVHEKEIQAEDDQVFLVKLQSLLSKQPAATAGRPVVRAYFCWF